MPITTIIIIINMCFTSRHSRDGKQIGHVTMASIDMTWHVLYCTTLYYIILYVDTKFEQFYGEKKLYSMPHGRTYSTKYFKIFPNHTVTFIKSVYTV